MKSKKEESDSNIKIGIIIGQNYGRCKRVRDPSIPIVEKEKGISRHRKDNWPIIKNGEFNIDPVPWGYNWALGYCEKSSNFTN